MGVTIRIEDHIPEAKQKLGKEIYKRMRESVEIVKTKAVEKLSGARHGRQYRIPGTNRFYTASAPGEPPAVRLGELRQHVYTRVGEGDGLVAGQVTGDVVGEVGTDTIQGQVTETGSKKMAPRPWLEPSFEESQEQVIRTFTRPMEDGHDND